MRWPVTDSEFVEWESENFRFRMGADKAKASVLKRAIQEFASTGYELTRKIRQRKTKASDHFGNHPHGRSHLLIEITAYGKIENKKQKSRDPCEPRYGTNKQRQKEEGWNKDLESAVYGLTFGARNLLGGNHARNSRCTKQTHRYDIIDTIKKK